MNAKCVHSCKGLCNAIAVAEQREQEAIHEYQRYADGCDYPDVKEVLNALIVERRKALQLLREKRELLTVKFAMIDRINDSFA
jgi:rubrerythrin